MTRPARRTLVGLAAGLALGPVVLLAGCSSPDAPAAPASSVAGAGTPTGPSTDAGSPTSGAQPSSGGPTTTASTPAPSSAPSASEGSVVPKSPVQTAPAKKLDQTSRSASAAVSLTSVRARTITAKGPGDTSGPGVLVRLKVRNTTGATLDTSVVQVGVANAAGAPGTLVNGSPTDPVGPSLKAGRTAEATYAFLLADARDGELTVLVQAVTGEPVVQFKGRAS